MSTHRWIDRICVAAMALCLLMTLLLMNGSALGIQTVNAGLGYESRLFDSSSVHTVAIVMDDWEGFLETCENEEYSACSVVIDGKAYKNIAIRAKGNTSLSQVSALGSSRYSFKLEFDHYDSSKSYYGLDKLCLNNIIQDNTYLKDYLTYQAMAQFGVDAPLCSFVYITVNGEDWGLYLAVEGVEDSFLQRNYGSEEGDLYKPDSMSMGGGRGNGQGFNIEDFTGFDAGQSGDQSGSWGTKPSMPDGFTPPGGEAESGASAAHDGEDGTGAAALTPPEGTVPAEDTGGDTGRPTAPGGGNFAGGGFGGVGSSDVKLQYIDDDPDSYSSIFENAKTDVTPADETRLIQALKTLSQGEDISSVVNVEEVLRYFVVHNYVVNGDSYTGSMIHNYYLYESGGQLSMIPWDYNLAFGGFQSSSAADTVNDPVDTPLSVGASDDRPMIDWIFDSQEYTELYHQYFAQFLEEVDLQGMIDSAAALIAPYVEKDPTKFCTYEAFETGVAALKEFCRLRTESVTGQLSGAIPSTDEGQAADASALVDASGLTISDMGSMNTGGTAGRGQGQQNTENQTVPAGRDDTQTAPADSQGDAAASDPVSVPGGGQRPSGFDGTFPGGDFGGSAAGDSAASAGTQQWQTGALLLAVSLAVLLLGLLAAFRYRRR